MVRFIPKLQRQFAQFLLHGSPERLRILIPSTCVGLRYDPIYLYPTKFFSAACLRPVRARPSHSRLGLVKERICLLFKPTCLDRLIQQADGLHFCVTPQAQTIYTGYGIINPFSIAYAFQPRLRYRLTLSRLTLLRKPQTFGGQVFHLSYRYLCQHLLFYDLQHTSQYTFAAHRMFLYHSAFQAESKTSASSFSPEYCRR